MERLDSGLVVIPDPDPGQNDEKENFSSFYESINLVYPVILSNFFKSLKY
ncbi:MAG: hypothetical protein JRJ21_03885 [Deltaproteobacteria bacterium]|nr:hypothetical protein [Deltaproteobacteria bacterium]